MRDVSLILENLFLFRNRCLFLPPLASFAEKRARPRSPILSSPWKSRNMFFGFRSRCTIPLPGGGTTHQITALIPKWLQELCGSPGRCSSASGLDALSLCHNHHTSGFRSRRTIPLPGGGTPHQVHYAPAAVERMWHIYDSEGQILAVAIR